jgi:hypothetical protein
MVQTVIFSKLSKLGTHPRRSPGTGTPDSENFVLSGARLKPRTAAIFAGALLAFLGRADWRDERPPPRRRRLGVRGSAAVPGVG